jgi:hypothetical protein
VISTTGKDIDISPEFDREEGGCMGGVRERRRRSIPVTHEIEAGSYKEKDFGGLDDML